MDPEKRMRMAAESILENEALRAGLEDEAASALLNWGVERAKKIAGDTSGLEDESEAEEASYPRMRALRQMLTSAARLSTENMDSEQRNALIEEIKGLVPLVYGEGIVAPQISQRNAPLVIESGNAQEKINALRNLIENNPSIRKGE